MSEAPPRPTKEEIAAAHGRTVPDVIGPGLRILFCGINPGLYSGATGHHFSRPGNRFWPTLERAGLTPRRLYPHEERELLDYGIGITNFVRRATAGADELSKDELIAGAATLRRKVRRHKPRVVAFLGITAYRAAFGRRKAVIGPQQESIGETRVWVLPNPSGLNAHYQIDGLAREFVRLLD
ncbi:MAG: G/U mismatch-specific DNA glycosylase [Actinomycetota bacterium]